jgi:hypothetical protein
MGHPANEILHLEHICKGRANARTRLARDALGLL